MCQLEQNKKLAKTFPRLVYTKEKDNYKHKKCPKKPLRYPSLPNFHLWDAIMQITECIKDWNTFKKKNSTENLTYLAVINIFKKNVPASF